MAVHRKEKAEIHAELLEAKLAEKEAIGMEQNSSSLRLAQEACVIDYRSQWADYRSQWADFGCDHTFPWARLATMHALWWHSA
jgi:hypothetical protein